VAGARQIRQTISDLNRAGTTIFLTTHYIEEAERLCGRIAFIVAGRIVKTGTVESLMRQTQGRYVVHFAVSANAAVLSETIVSEFAGLNCHLVSDKDIRVESTEPVRVGPLVRLIEDQGAEVFEARGVRPSLEEVFVQITGIEAKTMKQEKEKARAGGGA
jgi:ABC-2 type transport system ATP-binding protein